MAVRPPSAPEVPTADNSRYTVPSLNLDPVQSLRPWPVLVPCCNEELEIPALPAADWLAVLLDADMQLDDIFPGLLSDEDIDWVEEQLLLGQVGVDEFQETVLDALEVASARKWWVTLRLASIARQHWDVVGPELVNRGVDAARVSLSAWLDSLLVVVLRNMDPKDITMFTMRLEATPESEGDPEEMEMDRSAFMALGS